MAPKILDLDHPLGNAEVLDWVKKKREQHALEDADDQAAGIELTIRPKNFMEMLDKTEKHLMSDAYPYAKNEKAYNEDNYLDSFQNWSDAMHDRISKPVYQKYEYMIRNRIMAKEVAINKFEEEMEKKLLTEPEKMMIFNHAPTNVEMLEPMIEEVEDRFTKEELKIIVDCCIEFFRSEEREALKAARKERKKAKMQAAKEAKKKAKEGEEGEAKEGDEVQTVDDGGFDMANVAEATREVTPFEHRQSITTGPTMNYTKDLAFREAQGPEKSGANKQALGRANRLE